MEVVEEQSFTVPSLFKLACLSCTPEQFLKISTNPKYKYLKIDVKPCCLMVKEIIEINSAVGTFDPQGNREDVYDKVKINFDDLNFFRSAIKYGHLECLKMVHELGRPLKMSLESSFREMYDFRDHKIYAIKPSFSRCPELCSIAAYYGKLACLEFFHQHKLPWNVLTCVAAILSNNIDCLKYAVENGCAIDKPEPIQAAAAMGKLVVIKYLHENGCPWSVNACTYAARKGYLECLKFMRENGCEWDISTCTAAVKSGNFECLKYIVESGCYRISGDPVEEAAFVGNLNFLKYLREQGFPWSDSTCGYAAGQITLSLRCAHLERFSIDESDCVDAFKDIEFCLFPICKNLNHLHDNKLFNQQGECLVYAWLNGCPWDLGTCSTGSGDGRMDCLLSEPDHKCMWDKNKFDGFSAVVRKTRPITWKLLETLLLKCVKQILIEETVGMNVKET